MPLSRSSIIAAFSSEASPYQETVTDSQDTHKSVEIPEKNVIFKPGLLKFTNPFRLDLYHGKYRGWSNSTQATTLYQSFLESYGYGNLSSDVLSNLEEIMPPKSRPVISKYHQVCMQLSNHENTNHLVGWGRFSLKMT